MVHTGEEFAMVLDGSLEFTIDGDEYYLEKGDSLGFKASIPHRWKNNSSKQAKILWIVSPPPNV